MKLLKSTFRSILAQESNKWDPDKSWRLPSVAYTMEHKLAFLEREHYLCGGYSLNGFCHDVDKLFMYCNPLLNEKQIQQIHRSKRPHHVCPAQRKVKNLLEMFIDWDCAAITKPDKPLDAYATLLHFYQKQIMLMFPICLAANPDRVSPIVMDLDEKRKIGYSGYLFQSDDYNRNYYQQARFCMASIAEKKSFCCDKIRDTSIDEMEPWELFYCCLKILAQRRKQKINFEKVHEVLKAKQEEFNSFDCFQKSTSPTPLKHHFRMLSKNPFFG